MERVFEPLLADMHEEYCAALTSGRVQKARLLRRTYYLAFGKAVIFHALLSLREQFLTLLR